jgi:hypothetical protein
MIKKIKQPTHLITVALPLETYTRLQALCDYHLRSTPKMMQYLIDNTPLPSVAGGESKGLAGPRLESGPILYNYAAGQR